MKILAFWGSPRRNGNTRLLLDAFIDEVARAGHGVETVGLADRGKWQIAACLGCDRCTLGKCIQNDSMQVLYPKLQEADAIVLAAPIYFYGLPAHVKAMIDRCQLFFNQSYNLKEPVRVKPGKGVFISCGATKGQRLFDGAILTVKYWFNALGTEYSGDVLVRQVDGPGDVLKHPEAFEQIRMLAKAIATGG